jgi:monoterpene epsilon-lactone hydrolase
MSVRAEIIRLGLRKLIKSRGIDVSAEQSRRHLRTMESLTPAPPANTRTATIQADHVRAALITVPASSARRHVLFLHGGGYRSGSPSNYRHFTWRIAAATRARVLAVDYRLAPEHPFPAALDDAVSAYRWLLGAGAEASNTLVMGDSAGGGLALAMLLKLRDDRLPLPAAAVALSPWTDLALTGQSLRHNARADPMLNADDLPALVEEYLAGADPRLPYASPLYGDLAGMPPTLLQVGSDEILLDDAVRMHERLRSAGCIAELEIWPRMPHVWHLFAPVLPEAGRAIGRMGSFVQRHLPAPGVNRGPNGDPASASAGTPKYDVPSPSRGERDSPDKST